MSEKSEIIEELQDKGTRDAFVSSQISIPIAFQISALRQQRGWTQKQLAEKADMLQPRINTLEHPSGSEPNLRTLKRLASAFDVALIVRFASFSEVLKWAETFSPDTFEVPNFEDDPGIHEREGASEPATALVLIHPPKVMLLSTGNKQHGRPGTTTPIPFLDHEEHTVDQRTATRTIKANRHKAYTTNKPSVNIQSA
jgi:transcriptional regulator with XRE-family HTH domain